MISLLLLIAFVAMLAAEFIRKEDSPLGSEAKFTAAAAAKPSFPEDLPLRLEIMAGPPDLTAEEIEEEIRIDEEQVTVASEWLKSEDPEQRIGGTEQLSAYPTPQAEQLLVETLTNDIDPEVRSSAARNLGLFEQLQANTVDALVQALETDDEEVRLEVLSTLQVVVEREPYGSKFAQRLFRKLIKIAKSGQLQTNSQVVLSDFLADQAPGWQK